MKVLDLACALGHVFEGWFASEDDFVQQRQRALLSCPVCGAAEVEKKLSAPRLNLKSATPDSAVARGDAPEADTALQEHTVAPMSLQAAYLHMVRQWMADSEDVGRAFAQQARAMHLGDLPERAIRGQASAQEAQDLIDEGIPVLSLPVLDFAKHTLQ